MQVLTSVHFELVSGLLTDGKCPTTSLISKKLSLSFEEIEAALCELSETHGLVLHPDRIEPWVIHPFSLTPTLNFIESADRGWWAPCIWCAMGVAHLVGGKVKIHTRIGAESEAVVIDVVNGVSVSKLDLKVHFAIPPSRAWNNVHEHCSMVLPFHSESQADDWCHRHGLPKGRLVSLMQVSDLAGAWYGSHSSPNWHKWSMVEAQQIFEQSGFVGDFWNLGSTAGGF